MLWACQARRPGRAKGRLSLLFFQYGRLSYRSFRSFVERRRAGSTPIARRFRVHVLCQVIVNSSHGQDALCPLLITGTPSAPGLALCPTKEIAVRRYFCFNGYYRIRISVRDVFRAKDYRHGVRYFLVIVKVDRRAVSRSTGGDVSHACAVCFIDGVVGPHVLWQSVKVGRDNGRIIVNEWEVT